jgi:hypothetical protein
VRLLGWGVMGVGVMRCVGEVVGMAGVLGAVVEKARICKDAVRRVRVHMVVVFVEILVRFVDG